MIFKDSKRRVTGIRDKAVDFKSERSGIWHCSVFNLGMFLVSMGSSLSISEMSMIPVCGTVRALENANCLSEFLMLTKW